MTEKDRADKRTEVLAAITPICEAFGIKDFNYIFDEQHERLRLYNTLIGCGSNSVSAVVDEVIGYIFVVRYCHDRSVGAFEKQTLNAVKRHWIKEAPHV